ncbi:MAG: hypothetical protein QJR08_00365 [Bacillota bacterium]|nr:hypothetical protein [Bacillota bacterium]
MRKALAAALAALAVIMAPATAAAETVDSPTFRYDYQRTGSITDGSMAGMFLWPWPYVVPLQGQSNTAPIEYGDKVYQYTHVGDTVAYVWSVDISGQVPGQAQKICGPVDALSDESFGGGQMAGLGVSPDGRWLAMATGKRLFWWPVGSDCNSDQSRQAYMRGPDTSVKAMSSGDPVFVPVPTSIDPSGYAICDTDWTGSLWCFGVQTSESIYKLTGGKGGVYQTTLDQPSDTTASMTTSPTVIPADGSPDGKIEVCGGVSGTASPRIACIHPDGSLYPSGNPYRILAAGADRHAGGFASSALYAQGKLLAQDLWGGLYLIDTKTGKAVLSTEALAEYGSIDIAAPALIGISADGTNFWYYAVADGWTDSCFVDFDLAGKQASIYGCLSDQRAVAPNPGSYSNLTPATVIDDGTDFEIWQPMTDPQTGDQYIVETMFSFNWPTIPAKIAGVRSPFSTLVADVGSQHAFVMWGDDATQEWCQQQDPNDPIVLGDCGIPGGLQIFYPARPITAWIERNPADAVLPSGGVPAGGECIVAITQPGQFDQLYAMLPDGTKVAMRTDGNAYGVTDATKDQGDGPVFQKGGASLEGCPPSSLDDYMTDAVSGYDNIQYPRSTDGVDPAYWGVGSLYEYQVWWVSDVTVPAKAGAWDTAVYGTSTDGKRVVAHPILHTLCPPGYQASPDGTCSQAPAPPSNPPDNGGGGLPPDCDLNDPAIWQKVITDPTYFQIHCVKPQLVR